MALTNDIICPPYLFEAKAPVPIVLLVFQFLAIFISYNAMEEVTEPT